MRFGPNHVENVLIPPLEYYPYGNNTDHEPVFGFAMQDSGIACGDTIAADAQPGPLHRLGARQFHHACLPGPIARYERISHKRGQRGDPDHRCAPGQLAGSQLVEAGVREVVAADEVHPHHFLKHVDRAAIGTRELHVARVVHQHVERFEAVCHGLYLGVLSDPELAIVESR